MLCVITTYSDSEVAGGAFLASGMADFVSCTHNEFDLYV